MDVKELRIGNWVHDSDREKPYLHQVVRIETREYTQWNSGDDFNVVVKIEGSDDGYFEIKPSGIPLTEEWMEKFGFSDYVKNCWVKDGLLIDDKGWAYWDGGVRFTQKTIYVHSLQNLYFAITGKELTIKEQ